MQISGQQNPFSAKDMEGGGLLSVGTTAIAVTYEMAPKSVIISASIDNTGTLYVGKSTVTTAGANAFCALSPGESVTIDYDDTTNALYVVASVASQYFIKGCVA